MSDTVENVRSISLKFLKKYGYLSRPMDTDISWYQNDVKVNSIGVQSIFNIDFPASVRFHYTLTKNIKDIDYSVYLDFRACHLGGYRYYFLCPAVGCHKRVTFLFQHGDYFVCRKCAKLLYSRQLRSKRFAAFDLLFDREDIEKKINTTRVKFFKGRLTKKYTRLLRKARSVNVAELLTKLKQLVTK